MIALLYLKHAENLSDEKVVERWADSPNFQFFSGQHYFEPRHPCDATTLIKFRQLLGEEGVEELLAQTINVAVDLKLIQRSDLATVIVDSTVQSKAIAHPTDSRLLEVARTKLVETAKAMGMDLKQTYAKEGKTLSHKAGRYAHARQYKRMHRTLKCRPGYPNKGFKTLTEVRGWVMNFVRGYNTGHRHSALKFVTPAQRHQGPISPSWMPARPSTKPPKPPKPPAQNAGAALHETGIAPPPSGSTQYDNGMMI